MGQGRRLAGTFVAIALGLVILALAGAVAMAGVQLAPLGPEWPKLRQLCLDRQLSGNQLPDAWLAAAVEHLGEHLVSFDRGFRRLLPRSRFTLLPT